MVNRDLLAHGIKRRVVYGVPRLWSIPAQVASTEPIAIMFGRGSWIRTNDLQYPKQVATVDNAATEGQRDQSDLANH